MWRLDRDKRVAINVIEKTEDAWIVSEEYFVIRTIYVVEKAIFGSAESVEKLGIFNTLQEATDYMSNLVEEKRETSGL